MFVSGDGADKAYVWRLVEKSDTSAVDMVDESATATVEQPVAAEEEEKKETQPVVATTVPSKYGIE